jgi:hypothetical protein
MEEPSRRVSRLSIAAATLAAIAVGTGGFVLGRSTVDTPPAAPADPAPAPPPTPAPVLPAVQPPLGRAELISAVGSAADAFASGRPLPESVTALAGRDFELRLPFACPNVPVSDTGLTAEYDEADEALRVRADPVRWPLQEWLPKPDGAGQAAPAAESIEGFWISRPWTSSDACPAPSPVPDAAQPPGGTAERTLGIAQLFDPQSSRLSRRDGKPYEAVKSVAPEALNLSRGLYLRLRGKLSRTPGIGPVSCRALGGARPVCLLVVSFDQVAIENPATGETLSTWDVSSGSKQ